MAEDMTDPHDVNEVADEDARIAPDELSRRYNERYKKKMEMMARMVSSCYGESLVISLRTSLSICVAHSRGYYYCSCCYRVGSTNERCEHCNVSKV